ncbi:uncharacterized protein LOC130998638 [Salvia miltiorrhiza]|uniref:uncharacterized protein LOC130998638 n=1 Tax=Salvia miltiorrhiza TaxID=226208 RepID=UPI0025AD3C11|nr:uncharacterized protein LOC130998638 [Salvia miltiorrhiza]
MGENADHHYIGMRIGKGEKLRPRYIGPFDILERVGEVAYRLALPPSLTSIHNVFYVSSLRKYVHNPDNIVNHVELELDKDLTSEEHPTTILDRKVHVLRNKEIPLVKVQWSRHDHSEATWEKEEDIRSKYPHLFDSDSGDDSGDERQGE